MTTFTFIFNFQGNEYEANCHVIPPPPDKQYHINVPDSQLAKQFGDFHIIVVNKGELNWGIPGQAGGSEFMRAIVSGLKAHPQYR